MGLLNILKKNKKFACFTTPSHGQKFFITSKFRQFYKFDISETDVHNPQAALENAQKRAAEIYKTRKTLFLINGSTSGIIASVLSCVEKGEKVLIWDNSHICHKNAVDLAGAETIFYSLDKNEEWGIYEKVCPYNLEKHLKENQIKAVIVTSPSYEGVVSDISEIQNVCKKYGAYLIVDEAHGALYPFCEKLPQSAVNVADFTVQSLHKTAGGLNPTALLHTNTDFDVEFALSKINTTSPSYPLLLSIEMNVNYLNSQKGKEKIAELIKNIEILKSNCSQIDFYYGDITKILIKKQGLSGFELSEKLFKLGIEDEITNEKSTMLLCGLGTSKEKLRRLQKCLRKI